MIRVRRLGANPTGPHAFVTGPAESSEPRVQAPRWAWWAPSSARQSPTARVRQRPCLVDHDASRRFGGGHRGQDSERTGPRHHCVSQRFHRIVVSDGLPRCRGVLAQTSASYRQPRRRARCVRVPQPTDARTLVATSPMRMAHGPRERSSPIREGTFGGWDRRPHWVLTKSIEGVLESPAPAACV